MNYLLIQSISLQAMQYENDEDQYKSVLVDTVFNQGNKNKYSKFIFNDYEINMNEDSNLHINPYNSLSFNNSKIIINNKVYCSGDIDINLNNNSQLVINNNKNLSNLFEMGANILLNNNSLIVFDNNDNENVMNLFNNPKSKTKITLLNGSQIHFNNNIVLGLNDGSKVLINNGLLKCLFSKFNMSKGSQIISKNGESVFENSECKLSNGEIILNNNSKLYCIKNTQVNSNNNYIALDNSSNIIIDDSLINLDSDKIELNNNSEIKCTSSTINSTNNTTLTSRNSVCKLAHVILNLGDGTINILGDDTNDKVNFAVTDSKMESDSLDCMFNISAFCRMLVQNSHVYCLGRLIKLGSSQQSDNPLITVEGKSYFAWNNLACDHGYDIRIGKDAIVLIINKLMYDDLKDKDPTVEEDNNEEEEEQENNSEP